MEKLKLILRSKRRRWFRMERRLLRYGMVKTNINKKASLLVWSCLLVISTCFVIYISQINIVNHLSDTNSHESLETSSPIIPRSCCSTWDAFEARQLDVRRIESRIQDGGIKTKFQASRNVQLSSRFSKPKRKKYNQKKLV